MMLSKKSCYEARLPQRQYNTIKSYFHNTCYSAQLRTNHLYFILQYYNGFSMEFGHFGTVYILYHFLYFRKFVVSEYRETGQQIISTLEIKFCDVLFCFSR